MDMQHREIDDGGGYTGFQEAFNLVCSNLKPLGRDFIPLESSLDRIAAADIVAPMSYPSDDVSLKDGFAIRAADISSASRLQPVALKVVGSAFAGFDFDGEVTAGNAVRICSGARIPAGADAVVASEFCREISDVDVHVLADAAAGRNVLGAGSEVKGGSEIIKDGDLFRPGNMGLAAAAGVSMACVYRRPKAAVVGIGDEVVAPGEVLLPGQLYASNLVTMCAWLNSFGVQCETCVVKDNARGISYVLEKLMDRIDVILTSGGAWGSERDLVVGTLEGLGWKKIFHHVRMGPGKGIAFGMWKNKPVFCLPGGPASNEMALLQLALPGILRMSGDIRHPLPTVPARLLENVAGRHKQWMEFKDAVTSTDADGNHGVELYRSRSRLQAIAGANSLLCIPEGIECQNRGDIVPVQLLSWDRRPRT